MNRTLNIPPNVRHPAVFVIFSALAFYVGTKLSGAFDTQIFYAVDPLSGCVCLRDVLLSLGRGMLLELTFFLFIFLSAFSPFCTVVCVPIVCFVFLRSGLMIALLSLSAVPLYIAGIVSAISVLVLSSLSATKSPLLRRAGLSPHTAAFRTAVGLFGELLVISGVFSLSYVTAALITHFF